MLAVSAPSTRPRREWNQRFTTAAPITIAAMPVPAPTPTPHRRKSCHGARMKVARRSAVASVPIASAIVRRTPMRSAIAAQNGPMSP